MYDKYFVKIYDQLYKDKNYNYDVENILNVYSNIKSCTPKKMLDVGCGTGNHILEFQKTIDTIFGIDINPEMIKIAKRKIQNKKCHFYDCSISEFNKNGFDLVVSLFFVVNHVTKLNELIMFFQEIYNKMDKNGLFFFDCYNGSVVMFEDTQKKHVKHDEIDIVVSSSKDFLESGFIINFKGEVNNEKIDLAMHHVAWPIKVLVELLEMIGFKDIYCYDEHFFYSVLGSNFKVGIVCKK